MNSLSFQLLTENPLINFLGFFLVHSIWQATIIAAAAAILLLSLRRASANLRYLVACTALVAMIGVPLLTSACYSRLGNAPVTQLPASQINSFTIDSTPGQHSLATPLNSSGGEFGSVQKVAQQTTGSIPTWSDEVGRIQIRVSAAVTALAQSLRRWFPLIVALWAVGIAFLATRFIAGLRLVRILRASGRPASDERCQTTLNRLVETMGIRPLVRLVESHMATVPAVIGWLRPMILVPASMTSGLSVSELEALLAHELAHIRRHDYLVNVIQSLAETVLFFHPAIWWLSRAIRIERENCCDDIAIQVCGNRVAFARALARMEELRSDQSVLVLAASGGSLVRRIRRVVGRDVVHSGSWMATSATVLVLLIGFVAALGIAIAGTGMLPAKAEANQRVQSPSDSNDEVNHETVKDPTSNPVSTPADDAADDDETPPPITILSKDNDRVTKCRVSSQSGGRSATELLEHFSLMRPQGEAFSEGSIVNQETIVSAQPRYLLPIGRNYGMDADEVNFSLPEGAGMQAVFTGGSVEIESDKSRTVLTVTDGRVDLIDAVGVTRASASADGGANQLIIECTTSNREAAMVLRTNKEDCPVQVRLIVETGAPPDEKDPPHGAIRYTVLPKEGTDSDPVRMKMQWHYDLKQLAEEAETADPTKNSAPRTDYDRSQNLNKDRAPISDPAAVNELDLREPANPDEWGPRPKQGDLRARLTLQTEKPVAGQPLRFRLEIKNFGVEPQEFDPQFYMPFITLRVIRADGLPDWFIGPTPQTMGVRAACAPDESVMIWDDVDATELYMLEAGDYTIEAVVRHPIGSETMPQSNVVHVKVLPGEMPPFKLFLLALKKSLPKDWRISTNNGALFLMHSPTGLKKDVTTIQIWFTPKKLEADFGFDPADNLPVIQYFGEHVLGHANISAPQTAKELWPSYSDDVRRALGLESPDPQENKKLDENRLDPNSRVTTAPGPLQETSEHAKPWSATGRVTDGEGNPIAGATVRAHCGMGTLHETGSATTDADGRYKLSFGPGLFKDDDVNLQAATISVHLDGHFEKNMHRQGDLLAANKIPDGEIGWGGKKPEDVFLADKPKTIDFVMLPAAHFRGTVVDQDGKKLSGIRISLTGDELPPSSSVVAQTRTDDEGRFEIGDVPTGFKFQILVEPAKAESPWLAWASPPVEFVADESHDAHMRYSDSGKAIDFSVQRLTLLLHGTGVNWKSSLEESKSKPLAPKYDGLSTNDGTIVSAGMAWIELGK